jgi:hypothetical protein
MFIWFVAEGLKVGAWCRRHKFLASLRYRTAVIASHFADWEIWAHLCVFVCTQTARKRPWEVVTKVNSVNTKQGVVFWLNFYFNVWQKIMGFTFYLFLLIDGICVWLFGWLCLKIFSSSFENTEYGIVEKNLKDKCITTTHQKVDKSSLKLKTDIFQW